MAHIVGGESVEAVLLLGVVVETGLKAQVEIVYYVPGRGAVDRPVPARAQPVVVGNRLKRGCVVAILLLKIRSGNHAAGNRNRGVLHGMLETAVA